MKRLLSVTLVAALFALCGSAHAGQIWTDGNGDGLPDGTLFTAPPSTNVTVGVWIDAQSFNWTNFLAYIEWSGDCISYVSAQYVVGGVAQFPIDDFSHPRAIGFGGSGGNGSGVTHIGNMTLHINTAVACCVTPIIDIYNPYYVFSQLGAGSAYMLFSTNPGTCYNDDGPNVGACCFPDCSCAILLQSECFAAGGNWLGEDTNCTSCHCPPQFEACCFPDGSCIDAFLGECPAGSSPQGAFTSCANVVCPPTPTGACCFPDFSCQILTPSGCAAAGGAYLGDGTDCSLCGDNIGEACCFPDGSCVDAEVGQCPAGSAGQGAGTSCATVFCPSTSVESQSWGKVKALFR